LIDQAITISYFPDHHLLALLATVAIDQYLSAKKEIPENIAK
jgi:hypothetical protein